MTTGPQAQAFADHDRDPYRPGHRGKTYSQVSAAYMTASAAKTTPAATLTKLSGQRQTAFMGAVRPAAAPCCRPTRPGK